MQTLSTRRTGSDSIATPRRSRLLGWVASTLAGLVAIGSLGCGGLEVKRINSAEKKPNNVWVFFTVKDGEEPVGGLTADNFEIFEDGKIVSKFESKQTIQNPEVAAVMYTMLLVDMSGSVTESDQIDPLVDAAKRFATKVGKTQKVGVYAFDGSDKLEKIVGFTDSEGSVESGLERLRKYKSKDPSTNLHGAVIKGLDELEKELEKDSRPLKFGTLVTFTDGADRAGRYTQDQMNEAMGEEKYENYEKLSIGVGADIEEGDLSAVGPNGSERATDQKKLGEAFDKIADRIDRHMKRFYLLSYCTPARAGEHQVTITAKDPKTEATGSLDYTFKADGFGPPPDCNPETKPSFDLKASVKEDGKSDGGSPGNAQVQGSGSVGK